MGCGVAKVLLLAVAATVSWLAIPSLFAEQLTLAGGIINYSPGNSSPGDNSTGYSPAGQTRHDVSVTDIQPSSLSAAQGEVLTINVTIQNLGASNEIFLLLLRDDSDGRDITSVSIALQQGQTLALGLPWDTSQAAAGSHFLTASTDLASDQVPGNNSATTPIPIEIVLTAITLGDGTGLEMPDASFGGGLQSSNLSTQKQATSSMFIVGHDATFGQGLARAGVSAKTTPYSGAYIANADATYAPSTSLRNPFQQGEIKGVVHMEGLQNSVGAYILAGTHRHFTDANGGFQVLVPSGTYDLVIKAPGYVPVRIANTLVNAGDLLTIPELTLPFGDANGDGRIDILDLSIAAANFGMTIRDMSPP